MSDKNIVKFQGNSIKVTQEEYETFVKSISTQEPTDAEIKLYLYDCDRRGVHPLDKLIYFTKRKGRYTPITSIDFMRIRAESSGVYAGSDDAVFEEGEKYPISASVTVWKMVEGKLGRFTAKARWDEYAPNLADSSAFMWKKMPHTMLAKCAEALALRKAFPGLLSGLYAKEEMAQDGRYLDVDPIAGTVFEEFSESTTNPVVENSEKETISTHNGLTLSKLRDAKTIVQIQEKTGLKIPDILKFINTLNKDELYTVDQIVTFIKENKNA